MGGAEGADRGCARNTVTWYPEHSAVFYLHVPGVQPSTGGNLPPEALCLALAPCMTEMRRGALPWYSSITFPGICLNI